MLVNISADQARSKLLTYKGFQMSQTDIDLLGIAPPMPLWPTVPIMPSTIDIPGTTILKIINTEWQMISGSMNDIKFTMPLKLFAVKYPNWPNVLMAKPIIYDAWKKLSALENGKYMPLLQAEETKKINQALNDFQISPEYKVLLELPFHTMIETVSAGNNQNIAMTPAMIQTAINSTAALKKQSTKSAAVNPSETIGTFSAFAIPAAVITAAGFFL
jgi:hypothetical protein